MITMTNIICAYCGKKIEKKLSEINRQKKRGKKTFYCDRICVGKNNVQHLHKYAGKFNNNLIPNNRSDQYTEFRWYIKNVIKTSKKKNQGYDIDLKYLKDLWEQQGGICPFTKEKLELRTHTTKNKSHPYSASLDRIDNSKGYIKGNVRFVSLIFNYARNTFSDDTVIEFCKKITASNHTG